MVATAVASYFLLTADYGPEPNAFDPVCFPSSVFLSFAGLLIIRFVCLDDDKYSFFPDWALYYARSLTGINYGFYVLYFLFLCLSS